MVLLGTAARPAKNCVDFLTVTVCETELLSLMCLKFIDTSIADMLQ